MTKPERRYFDRLCVYLPFLVAALIPASAIGQTRMLELKSADSLIGRSMGRDEVRELIGNVHFIQIGETGEETQVWCDRAVHYIARNRVELYGNVQVVRDSVVMRGPEGIYDGNERRAEMRRNVVLRRGGMVLTAKHANYLTDAKRAHFTGDVVVADSVMTTTSDRLTYFETEDRSIAVGNVQMVHHEDGMTLFADSLIHWNREQYTEVPINPRLVQIDTTSDGDIDTLIVISRRMEAYRDTLERFLAHDDVVIVRGDLAARAGRATRFRDRIVLEQQPIVWYAQSQVTGDSIAVALENRRLRSMFVAGRAMAISLSDSSYPNRYDQLTARQLTMYFENQKIHRIDAERNATSLYFLFDEQGANGVNRSSGGRVRIEFLDGKVDSITIAGGVEGQYVPEMMVAAREAAYNLDGFRVHANRPKRMGMEIIP